MRFWWVNQNQTYKQEMAGGYLWSPKARANGTRNPFYEFMREVSPGDLVFSFADTRIRSFGIARSHAYEAPKPLEFGLAGRNWDDIGWRVDVEWHPLAAGLRPADWMAVLTPHLPEKYSPLLPNGRGSQSIYLTELNRSLALALADLASQEAAAYARAELIAEPDLSAPSAEQVNWERHLQIQIEADAALTPTEKESIVLSRRGQGLFRQRVQLIETRCRITGVDRIEHLRASHCKPWRDATNDERLNGQNGLLLTPSIDHLFDRGFISFEGKGNLLVSPVAHVESLERMGVPATAMLHVGAFTQVQKSFLEFHRDKVFLSARR